jgi:hypothetical protein
VVYYSIAIMVSKMNDFIKLGSLFFILMTVGILYKKYEDKITSNTAERNDAAIREYLLTDPNSLTEIIHTKPILWIPIHYDYNSRNWESFGSRSSYDLNQPYMYLTVKSIIHHCKDSFHICLVDDNSFVRLMPNWKYANSRLANPVADHVRRLGVAKLLSIYGGMTVPPSFLCMRDLYEMYNNGTKNSNTMFIVENRNRSVSFSTREYIADPQFMGAPPKNDEMGALVEYMENLTETDKTAQSDFNGDISQWCAANQHIIKVDAALIGVCDKSGKMIMVEDLLSNDYLKMTSHSYGIYIPSSDILTRSKYSWFARLSGRQVLESNTILGKYLLISNAPDANISGTVPTSDKEKPEWIAYWQVPSNAPVWGVKPNYLGNNVASSLESS